MFENTEVRIRGFDSIMLNIGHMLEVISRTRLLVVGECLIQVSSLVNLLSVKLEARIMFSMWILFSNSIL